MEPGNCFGALLDYIHLNPVRGGIVNEADWLESYPWSSFKHYLEAPGRQPEWMETQTGFSVAGTKDSSEGRRMESSVKEPHRPARHAQE